MNLIKAFPEIDSFFSKGQFSNHDLLILLKQLEEKYKDKKLREAIASLIKLELLKFEIVSFDEKPVKSIITSSGKIKHKESNEIEHPKIEKLKSKNLQDIAVSLKWSLSKLKVLISQKIVCPQDEQILTEDEFQKVKEMFKSRLFALDRLNKVRNPTKIITNKNKQKSLGRSIDVYRKIEAIGLGKVIYIRKQ